jgi:predicted transglutaminase-like cysteine proteinase
MFSCALGKPAMCRGGKQMRHPLLMRALLGSAGLAACITLLSEVARAAEAADGRPVIVSAATPPNFAGTMAVAVKPTRYLDNWERARRDARRNPVLLHLIAPARELFPDQQIYYVQAAVPRLIHWRSDATEWGQHDYWASADETLQHGFGDDEDRAIVKMQALLALGFAPRDLYLTMGKDRVGGPETVLIVRYNHTYYVLDDTDGRPYPAARRPEFTPMLTFGYGGSWIHGYPRTAAAKTPAPTVAVSAASAIGGQ